MFANRIKHKTEYIFIVCIMCAHYSDLQMRTVVEILLHYTSSTSAGPCWCSLQLLVLTALTVWCLRRRGSEGVLKRVLHDRLCCLCHKPMLFVIHHLVTVIGLVSLLEPHRLVDYSPVCKVNHPIAQWLDESKSKWLPQNWFTDVCKQFIHLKTLSLHIYHFSKVSKNNTVVFNK